MGKALAPIYSCYHCRSLHVDLQDLLFVEENSSKGFCKEECIETFYKPLLEFYEKKELEIRSKLNLLEEAVLFGIGEEAMMKLLVDSPDEIWKLGNDLNENIYTYIKKYNKAYFIVLCTSYKNEPSYIFLSTKTADERFVSEFRIGEKQNLILANDGSLEEILERKKSDILARLISVSGPTDIPITDYLEYDNFFNQTLNEADEIYEYKDQYGDILITYAKSFMREKDGVFYLVICLKSTENFSESIEAKILSDIEKDQNSDENLMTIYPIFSIPTKDVKVYKEFCRGKLLSGHLSN